MGIDWHGHRDRGLGLINSLVAIEAGATRIHATAPGVGERTGNTEMDLLLVNLKLSGQIDNDLSKLGEYVQVASDAVGLEIKPNYARAAQELAIAQITTGDKNGARITLQAFVEDNPSAPESARMKALIQSLQ